MADTLRMGGWLNPGFDEARAGAHLERLALLVVAAWWTIRRIT